MDTVQYLLVMRHGERLDGTDNDWEKSATQIWNPPLTQRGRVEVSKGNTSF
jgi:hypothetical protein